MAQYLDKFRGTIGKRQADQVIKLLNKKKNTGQIRTIDEFSQQLDDLIRELTGTLLQPTLKVFLTEENDVIDSEEYNFMLDRVQDDLEAAFEEANNIDEVQKSHEAIVRDVILKNLRAGVAELESKVALHEFLDKDNNGFDLAKFSTFRESKEERSQRGKGVNILFTDPRTNLTVPFNEDANVELVGERLTLALDRKNFYTIRSIRQVFDTTFPQSDKIVERPGTLLSNVIDNKTGTYWVQSLLFLENPNTVKLKFELDMGAVKEINVIEIEPISQQGVFLEAIHYVDGNNIITLLSNPELNVGSPVAIQIRKIATRRVILTFRNESAIQKNFEFVSQDTLLNQSLTSQAPKQPAAPSVFSPLPDVMPSIDSLNNELNDLLGSSEVKDILSIKTKETFTYTGFSFETGFDNIRLGLSGYRNTSIFVTSPLEVCASTQLGLKTVESRPVIDATDGLTKYIATTYDGDASDVYLGSIEYWLVKQDFGTDDALFRTTRFSVLPLGVSRVHHERLLLTEKSAATLNANDVGVTVFYTVSTSGGAGDGSVVVYRNGTLLANIELTPTSAEGWKQITALSDQVPGNNTPMSYKIQIIGGLPGDIYTVSYTPMLSSTPNIPEPPYGAFLSIGGLQVVDLVGDFSVRRNEGQRIVVENVESSQTIARSDVFLVIMLRRNTADAALSPIVEEYTLMGSCEDLTKFVE